MNPTEQIWPRLAAAARRAPAAEVALPPGFATRVAALGLATPGEDPLRLLERFAWRGLVVACACSLAAVAFSYSPWVSDPEDDLVALNDTVSELLLNAS